MPERLLEIPSLDEIRRVFGNEVAAPPANAPDQRPDDTTENDHD